MREYSTPLDDRDPGAPGTSPTTSSRTVASTPTRWCSAGTIGGGWADVTAAEFLAQVSAVAKGLVAVGLEAGRPGRADLPHPLRVDGRSTTRSGSPAP